jgi:hypothetical protein
MPPSKAVFIIYCSGLACCRLPPPSLLVITTIKRRRLLVPLAATSIKRHLCHCLAATLPLSICDGNSDARHQGMRD